MIFIVMVVNIYIFSFKELFKFLVNFFSCCLLFDLFIGNFSLVLNGWVWRNIVIIRIIENKFINELILIIVRIIIIE